MYLLQSWKDSLSLFKPQNLRIFMLVTLKTIKDIWGLLIKYFWWLLVLSAVLQPFFSSSLLLESIISFVWLIVICVVARPSMAKKNYAYFTNYILHLPAIFAAYMVVFMLLVVIRFEFVYLKFMPVVSYASTYSFFEQIVFLCLFILATYFLLDMPRSLKNWMKAIRYSFKLFFYNLPTMIILVGAVVGFYLLLVFLLGCVCGAESSFCQLVENLINFLFLPLYASVIGNLYIKRLHEEPQLFFKEPKE